MTQKPLVIDTPRAFLPLLRPSRYKVARGGRGSGKSHFFAELLVERHIMAPTSSVCIREIQKTLNHSAKRLIESKIQAMGVSHMFRVKESEIECPGGGVMIFQGMQSHNADSIKSLDGFDIAWVEEAQSISQRSLDLLRPTIRKPGSELWFSYNPDQPTDPIDALFKGDNIPPDSIVIDANYWDNPYFPDVLRVEMEYDRTRDHDKFKHVWCGAYNEKHNARVFSNWRVEEFDIPPDAELRQGADWGFSVDPSVLVQCYVVGKKLYICHEAYKVGCEIDMLPALFMTVPDSERWPIIADSARPETISYMQRHGFPRILAATKGAKSVEEGVEFIKAHDVVIHPRCTHTIDEFKRYSHKTDELGNVLPILEDKDNHVIDAVRYALEAARRISAAKPAANFNFGSYW